MYHVEKETCELVKKIECRCDRCKKIILSYDAVSGGSHQSIDKAYFVQYTTESVDKEVMIHSLYCLQDFINEHIAKYGMKFKIHMIRPIKIINKEHYVGMKRQPIPDIEFEM